MDHSLDEIEGVRKEMASLVEKLGSMLCGILSTKKEDVPSGGSVIEESEPKHEETVAESNGEVNKSELVRAYFKKHGDNIRNKDVVEGIKKESGVEVAASMVSFIKARIAQKGGESKKGAPKKSTESKVWTSKAVSGSALIREYLEKNGLDSSNEEVVTSIKKTKGVEVKPTLVSSVRALLKRNGYKTSRVSVSKVSKVGVKKKSAKRGPTMPAVVVEVLKKAPKEGLELAEVTERALKSGYEYRGKKDLAGMTQNVYQALHTLSKRIVHPGYKGKAAIVLHEGRRYKLNPKALKNRVA